MEAGPTTSDGQTTQTQTTTPTQPITPTPLGTATSTLAHTTTPMQHQTATSAVPMPVPNGHVIANANAKRLHLLRVNIPQASLTMVCAPTSITVSLTVHVPGLL